MARIENKKNNKQSLEVPQETRNDKVHTVFKAALSVVTAGTASEIFGLLVSQPVTKRRQKWMQAVADKLVQLEEQMCDFKIENLRKNEEFISFLLEASQIAFKTHQEEKLNALRNSIGNYFQVNHKYDKKLSFLNLINELTVTHTDILMFISNNEKIIVEKVKGFADLIDLYSIDIDKYYFRKCVKDLENHGMIRISGDFRDFIGQGGYTMNDEGSPSIKIFDFGNEFIAFVLEETKIYTENGTE